MYEVTYDELIDLRFFILVKTEEGRAEVFEGALQVFVYLCLREVDVTTDDYTDGILVYGSPGLPQQPSSLSNPSVPYYTAIAISLILAIIDTRPLALVGERFSFNPIFSTTEKSEERISCAVLPE